MKSDDIISALVRIVNAYSESEGYVPRSVVNDFEALEKAGVFSGEKKQNFDLHEVDEVLLQDGAWVRVDGWSDEWRSWTFGGVRVGICFVSAIKTKDGRFCEI